ncbi:MAG: PDZ domain-containing protein [Vicinamibacterales bacterium]
MIRPSVSRETRLLVVTLVVSVVALLVLARFRFPQTSTAGGSPAPQPLERLAARATYDELAAVVGRLEARLMPSLVSLRVASRGEDAGLPGDRPAFVAALRVRDDVAVTALEGDALVQGVEGSADAIPVVVARDPSTGLALVRIAAGPRPLVQVWDGSRPSATAQYLAVAEGARGGVALKPVFVSRTDPVVDPRYESPLQMPAPDIAAAPGTFIFSLDGRLVGMTVRLDDSAALLATEALLATADRMLQAAPTPEGSIGIDVQNLSPAMAAATGAGFGAIVSYVDPGGSSAGHLVPGDVIEAIDGEPVHSASGVRTRVSKSAPGASLSLAVRRFGKALTTTVDVQPPVARTERLPLGLVLRVAPPVGVEVLDVTPRSVAAQAGFRAGDLITQVGDRRAPGLQELERAMQAAKIADHVLVIVRRGRAHVALALEKP